MHKIIDKPTNFASKLINWYREHKRDLPWRNHKDPYKIWLSEIILQQTRVAQGLEYYQKFVRNYPTVQDLAEASEDEVMKDWQGLGYYSRARNLHASAKIVNEKKSGYFPETYDEIKSLKGVGDYTAAAIASFAYDLPHAVLDGNVFRVLSRIFGIDIPIDTPKAKKEFTALAESLMPTNQAADFNQAIMEFGALQCTPKNPNCNECIFNCLCFAKAENMVEKLPLKKNKIKQRERHFNYLILESEDSVFIKKRTEKGIWQNLYDFPLIESGKNLSKETLFKSEEFTRLLNGTNYKVTAKSKMKKHILSHQIIKAKFYHLTISDLRIEHENWLKIEKKNLYQFPIPKLIENYLREETNFISLFS